MGIELDQTIPANIWHPLSYDDSLDMWKEWNPLNDSGPCADMCAALEIGTQWVGAWVECSHGELLVTEEFGNDRAAAWRLAALRVAAEIGRGMQV